MSYTVGSTRVINATSASGTTDFTFTFPYIKEAHIEVYKDYTKLNQATGDVIGANEYKVITNVSPKLIRLGTATASANVRIEIRRNSSLDEPLVDYADGSTLTANDLDTSALQSLYIDQELKDSQFQTVSVDEATGLPSLGESGAGNLRLTKVADPTAAQDAATKNYVDTKQFTTSQIQDGTIVNADINASAAIAGSKLQASTSSNAGSMSAADKSKLDGIDSGAKDDQTLAELSALGVATKTGTETLTNKTLTTPVVNDMSGTALVTSGTSTSDTKTYSAKRAGEIFYGKDTLSEIQSGETWSAGDDKIATTSAIDARIADLVDEVGGFVAIANETSFPATNPDIKNDAGTLVSIKEFASSHTPSGGTVTISNGAGSGNTVTITGCGSTVLGAGYGGIVETTSTLHTYTFHRLTPLATEVTTVAANVSNISSCASNETNINAAVSNATNINAVANNETNINTVATNNTNINTVATNNTNINTVATANSNISTIVTNITNVNSVGGSITNVNTVADNISSVNDFAARYRVASSAPSSSLDVGDLYFDTSGNELKVYNGSSWQGGVTATGNLVSKAGDTLTGDLIMGNGRSLKLSETTANGSHSIAIKAPDSVTADITLTLPNGAGSSGYLLQTDGTGTLSWITPPNSTGGGGTDNVFQENDQTVTSSYTLTANKNASSVGPLTLNSGVTIEIPANATLVIL